MASDYLCFVISETTVKQIKALPENIQLKFYNAVVEFGLYGIEPDFTDMEYALWIGIRDLIAHMKRKDESWLQKQRESGRKGAAKRWGKDYSEDGDPIDPIENNGDPIKPISENGLDGPNKNVNKNYNENLNLQIGPEKNDADFSDPQKLFLHYWQHTPEIFNAFSRIDSPKEWENFWKKSGITCDQVKTAMDNFIADVISGSIERRFIPSMPDRFVLKGWITKCQERLTPKGGSPPKHRIDSDNVPKNKVSGYFKEA